MNIIDDEDICIGEKRVYIEEAAICSNGDPVSQIVRRLFRRFVIATRSCKAYNDQTVLLLRLLNHLINKLTGRTEIHNTLLIFASPPFRNEQTDEGLAASSWKLQCDIFLVQSF